MRVELLVSEWCATCPAAEAVWRRVAGEKDFELAVLDLTQPEGKRLARALRIRNIPALVIDGELKAVGVVPFAEARAMVAAAPARQGGAARHAGLLLARDDRWFIQSFALWLAASAIALLAQGSLLAPGPLGGAGMHLFGGAVLCLLYGLGAHMLPRFTGHPIRAGGLAIAQLGCANAGLALLAPGMTLGLRALAVAGGMLLWASLALFALRLWPVLWPRPASLRAPPSRVVETTTPAAGRRVD